jgi:ATP-dependent Clp protease ATP-binding subunit ClpC
MFDRYTENARRAIFFARFEASHTGSSEISTEHLLIGVLRASREGAFRLLGSEALVDRVASQIKGFHPRKRRSPPR